MSKMYNAFNNKNNKDILYRAGKVRSIEDVSFPIVL